MSKSFLLGLMIILTATASAAAAAGPVTRQAQEQEQARVPDDERKAAEARWLAARESAERKVREGNYVAALQYYLEYTSQAEKMGRPGLVAWGKNNAAHMIIRMHIEDPSFDLAPAKKMLEEGLSIAGATEECREALARNLEYVTSFLR